MDNYWKDLSDADWERLDRYVTRRATPDELELLESWVNAEPWRQQLAATMKSVGRAPGIEQPEWDVRAAWEKVRRPPVPLRLVRAQLDEKRVRRYSHMPGGWRRAIIPALAGLAAALILVAGARTLVERSRRQASEHPPVEAARVVAARDREVVTKRGERATLDLPDGSQVILGPGSRLVIPAAFSRGARSREVSLDGEAFFTVQHNAARPFRVATRVAVIEDVGTAFIVNNQPETRGTRVVVTEGRVVLTPSSGAAPNSSKQDSLRAPLVLSRGDLGRVGTDGTVTRISGVSVASHLEWIQGSLAFDATRLGDAIGPIERWYDLDISLADSALADRRFTGSFKNETAERVLEDVSVALNLVVKRSGRAIVLSAARTERPHK